MAQMTRVERYGIEDGLRRGWTIPEIAAYVKRPPQTVTNEIKNRRIDSSKGFKETNSTCRWYGECRRTHVCDTNCGMDKWCKHCHQCFLQCRDYEARTCDRLVAPPFVCNGCTNERICHLPKKFYVAKVAQADRESKLHVSRSHVHASDETLAKMNAALKDGLLRNQSVRHIMASNADAFGGLCERTVYNYIGSDGLDALGVGRGDLPYACSRRPRPKQAATKTDAKCRVNRTHDLFVLWKEQNPGALVPEADTLKGQVGGSVLFTIQFPCQLMMAFHKERETAQTWTGIVNMLYRLAGRPLFMTLFPAILEDNGAPFQGHELQRPGPGRRQRRALARQQLHARLARELHAVRRVREDIRVRGAQAPRPPRHREDPRERGDARPVRARQEVQATRRPHHPQAERREMTSNTEKRRKREK